MDMIEKIGTAAGEVWKALKTWKTVENDNEGMTIALLKKRTNLPSDLVYEAIGWLAREDKIIFSTSNTKTVRISLKE